MWVDAWRDGSEWKTKFVQNNPRLVIILNIRVFVSRFARAKWFIAIYQFLPSYFLFFLFSRTHVHRTVYVEIENYYVKMLTGWVGPAPVGEKDLAEAKRVLASFDLLLLTEWMGDDSQVCVSVKCVCV